MLAVLFGVYAGIIGLIIGFGALLHALLKNEEDDEQLALGQWLKEKVERDPAAWVRTANEAFLNLFDRLTTNAVIEVVVLLLLILAFSHQGRRDFAPFNLKCSSGRWGRLRWLASRLC